MAIVEVCVGSLESALSAADAGCHRLELCDNLASGGITPSQAWADLALQSLQCPRIVLIRQRAGDFCFAPAEKSAMLDSIERFSRLGATGFAIGAIDADGWDLQFMKQAVLQSRGCDLIAHRAIDVLLGPHPTTTNRIAELIDPLIELGYRRVLTSGGYSSAEHGVENLRKLVEYAAGRIEILPGGGVTPENAKRILDVSGASQIHGSFQRLPRLSDKITFDPDRFQQLKTRLNQ